MSFGKSLVGAAFHAPLVRQCVLPAIAFEDGGDATFENMQISGTTQAALPDNGAPVDVMEQIKRAQAQKQGKQPVPAQQPQSQYEEEFLQFEQQQGYGNGGGYDHNFSIPDDIEDELPFA